MNPKMLAIGVVVILAVAGAATAVILMNNGDSDKDEKAILTHRLLTMGNVCSDDTLDSKDVDVLKAVLAGDKEITVGGNKIDLTDAALLRYCDVNNDGNRDQSDVTALEQIIAGNASKIWYENANGTITSVNVPINNLVVMFRRVGTTIAMVGASDMVRGFISDLASGGNYGFLGFSGTNVGSAGDPDIELIKQMNNTYKSTGGVTLISDATGGSLELEGKVGSIDVVRMPVTEKGKSENGVVTLGYLLAYKNDKHDQIMDKLNKWIDWNDSAKQKIEEAVAKLEDSNKKSCIVGMWNTSGGANSINVRGSGVSEYEYTQYCGGKNIYDSNTGQGGYTPSELSEYLLTYQPDFTFIMQQEKYLLSQKVSAQTTLDELTPNITSNYHGKIGIFSQFFGTGPGYVLSLMYYASVLVPDLAGEFDIAKEYKFFMKDLVGNAELAEVQAFVAITA